MIITSVKSGSKFETLASYSRAVAIGDWIFVSNTAGIDYETRTLPDTAAEQLRLAIATVARALAAVDSSLSDVVRIQVFVPDAADQDEAIEVLGELFRGIDPALTMTRSPLAGEYKAEIEVTAHRGAGAARRTQIDL
ncbi:RidA family protein [Microbacterium phyllosphaerae]|uniref:RidA family protein n=1 Tax=Microbacterium phyllosphaerae TaxID=124798 RepID=UPI00216875B6|nr:RidA family protein [Microbacterium phyllosphaerae]MCS3442844.1 enamine deaminase RidA (YjgF/YER057c/UK114 family) [Microbacterium phyllosphaerae]